MQERRYYLERFLRKLARFDFLINSEEFQIFARPNGDIEKILGKLNKELQDAEKETQEYEQ